HALVAATALIRGSTAAPIRAMPDPYDTPAAPIRAGSAVVFATSQSSTVDTSRTSTGPATSIFPPESHQPRGVYDSTVYPRPASAVACARYSTSLTPQLLMNTTAGWRPAVVGSTTFADNTTPSGAVMPTNRIPVAAEAV